MATPAASASLAHGGEDLRQFVPGEALFENQADAHVERPRPHHGKIVDRAVHRQAADVAAGEEDRIDHIGIGGKGKPLAVVRNYRRIVLPLG